MTTAAVRELLRSSKAAAVVFPLSYNGVLFTRALHAEGVPVVGVVQPPKDCFWWTWSCRKVVVDDLYGEDTVATLIALGEIADIKPVLIATSDEGLLFITRHRERLAPFFRINVPRADTAALLMDKLSLYGWGGDRFDFPKTLAIHSDDDLARAVREVTMPAIIKPTYRDANWPPELDKAVLCEDTPTMEAYYRAAKDHASTFLVSEYVPGGDANIETCHVYYDRGRMLASYTDQKIRQSPPLTGTGAFISSCHNPEIRDITERFFDAHGDYSGVGGIEFKKDDRTGTFKIIEPFVGRPSSHFYTGLGEGFNFPYLVYCHVAGLEVPEYQQSRRIVSQLDEEFELRSFRWYLRRGEMTIWGYIKAVCSTRVFVRYSLRDPIVGLVYTAQVSRRIVGKALARLTGKRSKDPA